MLAVERDITGAAGTARNTHPPRRVGPVYVLSAIAFAVVAIFTVGATVFAQTVVTNQESRLLKERANEVKLVLSTSVSQITSDLSTLGEIARRGGPGAFMQQAAVYAGGAARATSYVLIQPGPSPKVLASDGPAVSLQGGAEPAATLAKAAQRPALATTPVIGSGSSRFLGFALSAGAGLEVYEQLALGPVHPPPQARTAPFSELEVVLYASATPRSSEVLVSTTARLPLHGEISKVALPAGQTSWLVAVSAQHPLVGSLAAAAPWVTLTVGLVAAILVFGLVDTVIRRREALVALYDSEHRFAETLQMRLLPTLPELVGLDISSRYVPASDYQQVGGDWFDAFDLGDGRAAVVIGDVMGHDVEAAAAMSEMRGALRASAAHGDAPIVVVDRLAGLVEMFEASTLVTVIYGVLDAPRSDGSRMFRWVNAGHLPPIVRLPDGRVEELAEATSPLLGAPWHAERPEGQRKLEAGTSLLLYTDGLVEVAGVSLDASLARLRATLSSLPASVPATRTCDAILGVQLPHERRDDIALVVVRVGGVAASIVQSARSERYEPPAG